MIRATFLALVFFSLFSFAQAQNKAASNVPGFRSIEWGSHIDSIEVEGRKLNFKEDEESSRANAYILPKDRLNIGTVKLKKINYIFNDEGRFTRVFMIGDKEFKEDMEFILSYKFGAPSDIRSLGYSSFKQWKVGSQGVDFILTSYSDREVFTLTIESKWEYINRNKKNINVDDF